MSTSEKFTVKPSRANSEGQFGGLRTTSIKGKKPLSLEIRPLTVLIGPQGSGKSLVSQFVYFLRNWRFLIAKYGEEDSKQAELTPDILVRSVVERLRSGPRALAGAFIRGGTHTVKLQDWAVSLNPSNRQIKPLKKMRQALSTWLRSAEWRKEAKRQAAFIPAERIFFSRFINTPEQGLFYSRYVPLTMSDFAQLLLEANEASLASFNIPKEAAWLREKMINSLRGTIRFVQRGPFSRQWQWVPLGSEKGFEIEMAASGQMAGWPLYQVLIGAFLRPKDFPPGFAFHVEEPEIHLHPSAQVPIMESLIFMVNQGYRVLITTHSLTILRTLNVAMQRFLHHQREASCRIDPKQVAAYYLDQEAISLVKNGFIEENRLGDIDDNLGSELYTLWYEEEVGLLPNKEVQPK